MKKRFNIKPIQLYALIVVLFTSVSCSDKLFDDQAGERITPDQHYKSQVDAQASLGGAFAPLQNVMPKLIMVDGLRSDQMIITPNADPFLKDIQNHDLSIDNPFLDGSDFYKVIININEAMANIDKIAAVDRNFDQFYLKYHKAALTSLKGWTYLNIVRLYGKAALIEDNLQSLPGNMSQTVLSREEVIDRMLAELLPYIPSAAEQTQFVEYRFVNFPNIKAVVGELYLEKGDYANAVTFLKAAMESYANVPAVYKVASGTLDGWRDMFLGGESGTGGVHIPSARDLPPLENISVMPYDMNEGQNNPLPKWLLPTDQFMVQPTQLLVDSFLTQVPSQGLFGDVYRGFGTPGRPSSLDSTSAGVVFINKYSIISGEPFSSDITLSRAGDVHLLLAEALNRNGDSKNALVIMNQGFKAEKPIPAAYNRWNLNLGIRGRAYLKSKVVPDSVFVSPDDTITKVPLEGEARMLYVEDLIMAERALELAFEGKRWNDLVRVAKRRQDPAYLADKVAAKFPDSQKAAIRAKLMVESNWYLPYKKGVE